MSKNKRKPPASWDEVARLVIAWGEAKIAQLNTPEWPDRIRKLDEFDDRRIAYENLDFYLEADAGKAGDLMEAAIVEYVAAMSCNRSEAVQLYVDVRRRLPGGGKSEHADEARARRKPPPCVKQKGSKR